MYRYRNLTAEQRADLLRERRLHRLPLHAPPHNSAGKKKYLITTACYEHCSIMNTESRRMDFLELLLTDVEASIELIEVHAWVILPNHYHLLIATDLVWFSEWIRIIHSRIATRWNREDRTIGRKVWYRFSVRALRSERHYWATVNYIHRNPVKHCYTQDPRDWPASSINKFIDFHGDEKLEKLFQNYPLDDYGKGWDD